MGLWNPIHTGGRKQGSQWTRHVCSIPHADSRCENLMGFNLPNASYMFQLFICQFQVHSCQVEHLTIVTLSIPLYQETRIFIPLNSAILTGSPSNLWLHGWNPFARQLQKCLPPKYPCFRRHTQFFEAYRMTSRIFSTIFLTQFHQISNLVSWMLTASWVTITTSLMCLPSTYGLHVRVFLSNQLLSDFTNHYAISTGSVDLIRWYEGRLRRWSHAFQSPQAIKIDAFRLLQRKLCKHHSCTIIIAIHVCPICAHGSRLTLKVLHGSISQEREDLHQWTWRILQTPCWRFQRM